MQSRPGPGTSPPGPETSPPGPGTSPPATPADGKGPNGAFCTSDRQCSSGSCVAPPGVGQSSGKCGAYPLLEQSHPLNLLPAKSTAKHSLTLLVVLQYMPFKAVHGKRIMLFLRFSSACALGEESRAFIQLRIMNSRTLCRSVIAISYARSPSKDLVLPRTPGSEPCCRY